jgi:hypothetical protein
MTSLQRSPSTTGDFAQIRLNAAAAESVQRHRAARTVTSHAIDDTDCDTLLTMLGLSPAQLAPIGPSRSALG